MQWPDDAAEVHKIRHRFILVTMVHAVLLKPSLLTLRRCLIERRRHSERVFALSLPHWCNGTALRGCVGRIVETAYSSGTCRQLVRQNHLGFLALTHRVLIWFLTFDEASSLTAMVLVAGSTWQDRSFPLQLPSASFLARADHPQTIKIWQQAAKMSRLGAAACPHKRVVGRKLH